MKSKVQTTLLTTREVADILKITPNTVTKYIRLRILKGVKLGGKYLIKYSELENFINK